MDHSTPVTVKVIENNNDEESWFPKFLSENKAPRWLYRFADRNTRDSTHAAVAWQDGGIIGYWAISYSNGDEYCVSCGTYVVPRMRRKGLGSRLWTALLEHIYEQVGKRVEIEALAVTPAGCGFLYSQKRKGVNLTWIKAW